MSNINTGTTNIPIPESAYARWRRSKKLSYMTAWKLSQPRDYRNPTPREDVLNREAVVMLSLIAAAHYFVYDLAPELSTIGVYRHAIKRNVNRVEAIITEAHRTACMMLRIGNNGRESKNYNACMDDFYRVINEHISVEPPERGYNILMAICRLVGNYVNHRIGSYDFAPAHEVAKIPALLANIPLEDFHLDNIIDRAVRPIIFR